MPSRSRAAPPMIPTLPPTPHTMKMIPPRCFSPPPAIKRRGTPCRLHNMHLIGRLSGGRRAVARPAARGSSASSVRALALWSRRRLLGLRHLLDPLVERGDDLALGDAEARRGRCRRCRRSRSRVLAAEAADREPSGLAIAFVAGELPCGSAWPSLVTTARSDAHAGAEVGGARGDEAVVGRVREFEGLDAVTLSSAVFRRSKISSICPFSSP